MLDVTNPTQYYGESHILRDVQLAIVEGSCTCLMGRNGVGKTTLLKSIMGLLRLRTGNIRFAGAAIEGRGPEYRARLGIGYVPQGRELFSDLDVEENLSIGMTTRRPREANLERVYAVFPALKKILKRRGGDLSGGQQQQVAIGRALALSPNLMILDEPTEGIQPNVVHDIGDVLMKLNKEEKVTLLVV